jgi:hypothetical protein
MDEALLIAARALSRGDPLLALQQVALRQDARALALRATALAQLGEYERSKQLFLLAAREFGVREAAARARCVVALAEVALAARELTQADAGLARAIDVLRQHGDLANARHAQLLRARHALALGKLALADERLRALDVRDAAPASQVLFGLAQAELAVRRIQPANARKSLLLAAKAADKAHIPALSAEVEAAVRGLERPVARLLEADGSRLLSLDQVASLIGGRGLVVDAGRRVVQLGSSSVAFSKRPVLFSLARRLAEVAPAEVARAELIRSAFGIRRPNESLRARLRVAMGRLRRLLKGIAELRATPGGFALVPRRAPACVLVPPLDDAASSLLALVSDGSSWSTSALALALGSSQRSVQRALGALEAAGKVRCLGHGRSRRWVAPPLTLFATHLLLPGASLAP